jgi:large subunit ribosomal protein L25
MEKVVIHATPRTVKGKKVGTLRRQGLLPAVIYGHHMEATPVTLDLRSASRQLSGLTGSSLVTIELEGTEYPTLVREKQRDYVRGTLLHVDFQAVSLTEKIRTHVSIEITGTAPAVKDFNGVVVAGVESLEVESLPQYLPEKFVVDISGLAKIGDGLYVRDITVSDDVSILADADEMVVVITASAGEELAEGEAAAAEPELIEKGKKEEVEE